MVDSLNWAGVRVVWKGQTRRSGRQTRLGLTVGEELGMNETDGAEDGAPVGFIDKEGADVGSMEGLDEGSVEGTSEGLTLGSREGN